jgi:hypothetical protein
VAADASSSAPEIVDGVASLVAKSLIAADVSGAAGIYRLLDTSSRSSPRAASTSGSRGATPSTAWRCWSGVGRVAGPLRPPDRRCASGALDWAFSPTGDASLGVCLTVAAILLWFQLPRRKDSDRVSRRRQPRCRTGGHAQGIDAATHRAGLRRRRVGRRDQWSLFRRRAERQRRTGARQWFAS